MAMARESLQASRLCFQAQLFNESVSRAYYAVFHCVQAVLFTRGLEAKTHGGTHDLLYTHFVKAGVFPPEVAKAYAGLQRYRQIADYSRTMRFESANAKAEIDAAERLFSAFESWLGAGGWLTTGH